MLWAELERVHPPAIEKCTTLHKSTYLATSDYLMYILLLRNIEPHQTSPLELAIQLCCLQFHYMQQATACPLCGETNKPITRLYIDVLYVFPWSISVSHNFERDERVFNPQSILHKLSGTRNLNSSCCCMKTPMSKNQRENQLWKPYLFPLGKMDSRMKKNAWEDTTL